jgi:transposase
MDTQTLTFWQQRHLEQQLRSAPDARVFRRTLAILEVAAGEPVPAVARLLRVSPRAVYHWLAAYAADRSPASLVDADRPGRPTLLSDWERALLRELLAGSPQDHGYPATVWTVPLLQQHLLQHAGLRLSEDTIRREIHRLNYSWKRPRYRLQPDPEAGGKKAAYPQPSEAAAASQHGARRGRDRPAAVPAAAVVLVAGGPAQGGRAEWP